MRAHDILGLTAFANAEQVEKAYREKLALLSDGDYESQYPDAYKRKAEELATARAECLDYIDAPFLKKTRVEVRDSVNRAVSPNTLSACECCGDVEGCFVTIVEIACIGGVVSAICKIVSVASDSVRKSNAAAEAEAHQRRSAFLQQRHEEERDQSEELRTRRNELNGNIESATAELEAAETERREFERKMGIIDNFLGANSEGVYYKNSTAYRELNENIERITATRDRINSDLDQITRTLDEFRRHEEEYDSFRRR